MRCEDIAEMLPCSAQLRRGRLLLLLLLLLLVRIGRRVLFGYRLARKRRGG